MEQQLGERCLLCQDLGARIVLGSPGAVSQPTGEPQPIRLLECHSRMIPRARSLTGRTPALSGRADLRTGLGHGCVRNLTGAPWHRPAVTGRLGTPSGTDGSRVCRRGPPNPCRTGGRKRRRPRRYRVHKRRASPLYAARPAPRDRPAGKRETAASPAGARREPVAQPCRTTPGQIRRGGSGHILGQLVRPPTRPAIGPRHPPQRRLDHRATPRPDGARCCP